ncbi:MAG: hypothetical protein UR60_C0047G0009 [Candidatus Moranbacteria bacterium GW2011_GWF2_34_56]|nr:MAG: hypothetical protein UR51_C0009G0009 [Candidatus Moranbacteria bacterium GW2011_GWF1_34_10]KKP63269.1 MAG: hypothetical protein UR60_C0047G0009 [Candidatus Moranbacteria bacterium GW2011_GWF2_34_56]HBI17561.1 hypothetical protein [Candidatus Moranbacteria bacterium]
MKIHRLTLLTLTQLVDIVKGRVPAPDCTTCSGNHSGCTAGSVSTGCAANDIGYIFLNEDQAAGEKSLAEMMSDDDLLMASVGYFFLSLRRNQLLPETEALLKAYEDDPKNAELLQILEDRIAEFAESC